MINRKYLVTQLIITVAVTPAVHCAQNTVALDMIPDGRPPAPLSEEAKRELGRKLLDTASWGRIEQVKQLLSQGACIETCMARSKPRSGYEIISPTTPLITAILAGHTRIVRLLLAAGASVNHATPDDAPLLAAARCGNAELIKLLLADNADANQSILYRGSALCHAIYYYGIFNKRNYVTLLRQLLAHGADPNGVAWRIVEIPILQEAAERGHAAAVQLLYRYGAIPLTEKQRTTIRNQEAYTLLDTHLHFALERAEAVQTWVRSLEQQEGLPRDITRLIWQIAGEWPKYMPSVEGKQ